MKKAILLEREGPIISVVIKPPFSLTEQIKASGQPIPTTRLRAIIDTGAQSSSVSHTELQSIGLFPRNIKTLIGTAGQKECAFYDIGLEIAFGKTAGEVSFELEVAGLDLDLFGVYVLIGRDILRHCKLIYNGASGEYELEFIGTKK